MKRALLAHGRVVRRRPADILSDGSQKILVSKKAIPRIVCVCAQRVVDLQGHGRIPWIAIKEFERQLVVGQA